MQKINDDHLIRYLLQEGGTKLIISKCEASRNGDYLGAMFESEYGQYIK